MTNNSKKPDFTGISLLFCTITIILILSFAISGGTTYASAKYTDLTAKENSISAFAEMESKNLILNENLGIWEKFALFLSDIIEDIHS